ncbi:MAG: Smr/MutS family protein [Dehalococcoidia bacterium]|jgi:DNA mismatch repair protein MutS2|nr:Smr/MutS family protein [Dehalococcoidia bacterium]
MTAKPDEIDLHGLTVDEAIPLVDEFLHKARKARLLRVWVVHGKGTGTLRRAVRDHLTKHPLVMRCSTAEAWRGGDGCTQVDLNN